MFINNGDGTYTVRFYTGTYGVIYNGSTAASAPASPTASEPPTT